MNTKLYDLTIASAYEPAISDAAQTIKDGGLVVFPTETVYGIGADAFNESAVKKIFEAKGRPSDNPLIVHISDLSQINSLASEISEAAGKLIRAFMPGPLTLILKKKDSVPSAVTAGLDTVAVRMPGNPYALDFIKACATPIAAPSANISGRPSPTQPKHVIDDMTGKVDVILTAGSCEIGIESTVIDCSVDPVRILRPGGLSSEKIALLVRLDFAHTSEAECPKSPGMKYRHYKPEGRVVALLGNERQGIDYINAQTQALNEASGALVFEDMRSEVICTHVFSIGDKDRPAESANRLFSHLRTCDDLGIQIIYVMCTDQADLGEAYLNRLFKAADEIVDLNKVPIRKETIT